ncbi:hypothetical protein ACJMK2_041775 [Sinanodonta woodiana]|uniref:PHD-type domain-containing protein n=1 Tax=Sinanodonta woodiana TaxID=1069815 RepID=A0ABD3W859_SINWO
MEGLVLLLAMDQLNMQDKYSRPSPSSIEDADFNERKHYLEKVSDNIVCKVWYTLDTKTLMKPDDTASVGFCCDGEKDNDFIGCELKGNCLNGEWFLYLCVNVDRDNIPTEWYCREDCRQKIQRPSQHYNYCSCHTDLGADEPMIGCNAENKCLGKEWYHLVCLGMTVDEVPKGKWYCSYCNGKYPKNKTQHRKKTCRKKGEKMSKREEDHLLEDDHVYNYSLGM